MLCTPAHFLGTFLVSFTPTPDDTAFPRLASSFQNSQRELQLFWAKWRREYLSVLQPRGKWRQAQNNIQCGDMVVIRDSHLPPGKWRLGRITAVHPGGDDLVRVVTIRTPDGRIRRVVKDVVLLPGVA